MIREEVATVLKSEMERQMNFIQQALKSRSDEKPTAPPAEQAQDLPADYCVDQESDPSAMVMCPSDFVFYPIGR